uniref:C-type lectin domain-containing protein n=1 Tax=Magallana gigas TaxID=29159 RepID=A0A8W8NTR1_MAGGI|nr:perlucin-like protein [Crassostrea gigas]|eukprot:XP_011431664.1 PREDICTED: perlucin-like protein [Crassostrea gigas]
MKNAKSQLLLLIIAFWASSEASLIRCEKGWVQFGKKCYKFSSYTATFKDAMVMCNNNGGRLLELQSRAEENWVDLHCRVRGYGFGVWLGLTDLQREGQYVAMSDARRPRYSNWVRGEPNNGNRQEHCAMYWIARRGWNDTVCTGRMNYVCKK